MAPRHAMPPISNPHLYIPPPTPPPHPRYTALIDKPTPEQTWDRTMRRYGTPSILFIILIILLLVWIF